MDRQAPEQSTSAAGGSRGAFNYLDQSVESSLYRNGKVFTRRDRDGSDSAFEGAVLDECVMEVASARDLSGGDHPTLAHSGFELRAEPLSDTDLDFFHNHSVVSRYYPECEHIIQDATGAAVVRAFDHNVRSAAGKESQRRIEGGQTVQGPAHLVHGDYTLTSAPQRLRDLTKPPGSNDTLRDVLGADRALLDSDQVAEALASGRFAIINLWRNIVAEPVVTDPLALCDAHTVEPRDLVVFEIHYADRVGENYFAKHSPQHRWYFYPELTRAEALLIKQWDSAGAMARSSGARADASDAKAPCTFSFHSAFRDPATPPDAPDRWSIEVRCAVIY